MAAEEDSVDHEIEEGEELEKENKGKKVAKHDSGAADLEKVTDYVEETEIQAQQFANAMQVVSDQQVKEAARKLEKEKELSKVKINKDDVDLIVREMEIQRTQAERTLREYKGNVVDALMALTN